MEKENKLTEVAKVFFKLGCFAFGGPAAHIAMMEEEVVNKRKWMDRQHYLDLIGATNLIPGPNSTEMTMHCGHERAGYKGLFVAGIAFIFPAVLITGILAWLYVDYGALPEVEPFVFGIKPAVLAVIAGAVIKLGKKAIKGWELATLGLIVLILSIVGFNEVTALLGAGLIGALYFYYKKKLQATELKSITPILLLQATSSSVLIKISAVKVFWTFLKVGSVLYGSGYVLFAYLDAELVEAGLMTHQALLDAIAVGQFTPGPVLSTSTFIGYQLSGFWGAIAATTGIFLPSFIFVLILNPLIPRLRKSQFLSYFLDSVNVAAVAVMLGVLFVMTKETIFPELNFDWRGGIIALFGIIITFWFKKINVMWTILGGSILGFILSFI